MKLMSVISRQQQPDSSQTVVEHHRRLGNLKLSSERSFQILTAVKKFPICSLFLIGKELLKIGQYIFSFRISFKYLDN